VVVLSILSSSSNFLRDKVHHSISRKVSNHSNNSSSSMQTLQVILDGINKEA
jgi:hypothetical protein